MRAQGPLCSLPRIVASARQVGKRQEVQGNDGKLDFPHWECRRNTATNTKRICKLTNPVREQALYKQLLYFTANLQFHW